MAYEYNLNPEAEELRNRTEEEAAMPLPEEAGGEIPPQAAPQQDAQAAGMFLIIYIRPVGGKGGKA